MIRLALLVILLLSGCAGEHSCYIGFSVIPPSPVVMCGVDLSKKEEK